MAMPRKSAFALSRWVGSLASMPSGEVGPNTVLTSLGMLSNSMLAIEKAPTSHPARVNGTHGAGAVLPCSLIISGLPSPAAGEPPDGAVQYAKELANPTDPSERKKP